MFSIWLRGLALSWTVLWKDLKLKSIKDNSFHPLHETVVSLSSSFSSRLLHPKCKNERYRRSFIPAAVRLFNLEAT